MKTEDKELLLKDLCARLPYKTQVNYNGRIEILSTSHIFDINHIKEEYVDIKSYLRPISSMTESEMDKLFDILHIDKDGNNEDWIKINDVVGIKFFFPTGKWVENVIEAYDYLNSIHIDYRGLIPMGLVLEAPVDMYKTE